MREWLARGLLVIASVAFTLGAVELFVRVALNPYACHERLGWTFAPGRTVLRLSRDGEFARLASFDSRGMRDGDRPFEKPADTLRVLVLGDSFMAALQVARADTFSSVLEGLLAREVSGPSRVEVLNAGVDGYGTAQQLLLFRELGHRFQPDLVLLAVFSANDVADNSAQAGSVNHHLAGHCGRPYLERDGERLVPHQGGRLVRPERRSVSDSLLRRSLLYATLVPVPLEAGPEDAFVQSAIFDTRPEAAVTEAWDLTQRIVLALRSELAEQGIPLGVLRVPSRREVWPYPGRNPGQEDTRPGELLLGFLEREAVLHLDLAPALRDRLQLTFFARDSHWSPQGHRAVADAVSAWLHEHCAEFGLPVGRCSDRPRVAGGRPRTPRDGTVAP